MNCYTHRVAGCDFTCYFDLKTGKYSFDDADIEVVRNEIGVDKAWLNKLRMLYPCGKSGLSFIYISEANICGIDGCIVQLCIEYSQDMFYINLVFPFKSVDFLVALSHRIGNAEMGLEFNNGVKCVCIGISLLRCDFLKMLIGSKQFAVDYIIEMCERVRKYDLDIWAQG